MSVAKLVDDLDDRTRSARGSPEAECIQRALSTESEFLGDVTTRKVLKVCIQNVVYCLMNKEVCYSTKSFVDWATVRHNIHPRCLG